MKKKELGFHEKSLQIDYQDLYLKNPEQILLFNFGIDITIPFSIPGFGNDIFGFGIRDLDFRFRYTVYWIWIRDCISEFVN